MHELIQSYIENIYSNFGDEIKNSMFGESNEIYGELYYYSLVKLLTNLNITASDHFLDIGSGLGKAIIQVFLTTEATSVTGIEINPQRYHISSRAIEIIKTNLPDIFRNRTLNVIKGDFLKHNFSKKSIIYVCSTVFTFDLISAIGEKINTLPNVKIVASLRKIPNLNNFTLTKKIFLHGTWDSTICYIYSRTNI